MTTAIILAGGESSRLRPLGDKSLQRFLGKSLLRRHLETLADAGVTSFVVVANPTNEAILRDECAGQPVQFVIQPQARGMGDAVGRALTVIAPESPVYITQAHDVFDEDFHHSMLNQSQQRSGSILIAAKRMETYFPGGYLLPVGDGEVSGEALFAIRGIIEKPGAGNEPSRWVTLVAHLLPRAADLLAAINSANNGDEGDLYERALTAIMGRQPSLAVPHNGPTASLKFPWHMLDVTELLLQRLTAPVIHPSVIIPEGASVRGNVIIEEGVRLFAGAAVLGPAYIGHNTILGNNALVRDSIVGSGCIIGYSTEVARSWLGNDVWFHTNYVGDSIIDSNVSFGSGTVTGNLRLDEGIIKSAVKGDRLPTGRTKLGQIIGSGTRVGINASLMPGVVIGRDAFVGPGVILGVDVPDGQRVKVRQELEWGANVHRTNPADRDAFRGKLH